MIQLIVGSGCGEDIMPHILQHLDFLELAELGAVCELYSIDIVHYVKSNTKLRNKIIIDNYFAKIHVNKILHSPCSFLNYDRLWELTPEELLIEVRVLSSKNYEGLFAIDMVAIDNNQRPSCIPLVAFNPVYPVAAIAEYHSLMIVAYGGPIRFNQGQLLYSSPFHCFGENVWFSWNPLGTCLLSCVQYTDGTNSKQIDLFKFNPDLGTFRKLITPNLELSGSGTMLTRSIWISENSFIWTKGPESPLLLVTITKRNEVIVKTLLDSCQSLMTVPDTYVNLDTKVREQRELWPPYPNLYPLTPDAIFGNLFAVADSRSPYYFCLTWCPVHVLDHQCIAVVSRHDFTLKKLIYLPGLVIEIATVENTLFVLFSKLNALTETDKRCASRVSSDVQSCIYPESPLEIDTYHKSTELVSFTDADLEPKKLTEVCETCRPFEMWHKSRWGTQRTSFNAVCESKVMNATKDFVSLINIGMASSLALSMSVTHEKIYTNHHFFQQAGESNLQGTMQPTTYFYHPTKPFMFTHRHDLYNSFDRPFFSVTPAAKVQDLEGVVQLYDEYNAPYNNPISAVVTRETS